MFHIVQREIKNYLKNPLLWIGIVIVFIGIYQCVSPYLGIHYFESDSQIKELPLEQSLDADIMQGYIMSSEEQKMQLGMAEIKNQLLDYFGTWDAQEKADAVLKEVEGMSIEEMNVYLEEKYSFYNTDYIFQSKEYHKATAQEANAYIDKRMEEAPFSYYFSAKFADFAGLFMGAFATILLAFLFIWDTKKDIYELLHTKPVRGVSYIFGKIAGGFAIILLVITILSIGFSILCMAAAGREGFSFRIWDIPLAAIMYILPNMLMITSVYAGTSLLFKTPLPAVPLLFLYIVYSNMGSIGPDGRYGYYGRPLAIMVRFPGTFFDVTPPPYAVFNQLMLVAASILLSLLAVMIWKRRRVY